MRQLTKDTLASRSSHPFGIQIEFASLPGEIEKAASTLMHLMRSNGLVVVKNVSLSADEYLVLGRYLGTIRPFVDENYRHPDHPEIFVVSNVLKDGKQFGMDRVGYYWHSDSSFLPDPLPCTLLYAQQVSKSGGQTSFIDMAQAYDRIEPNLREYLNGKTCLHEGKWKYIITNSDVGLSIDDILERDEKSLPAPSHPLVFKHPFTKKPVLYLTEGIALVINKMDRCESRDILSRTWIEIKSKCEVYTHQWEMGDLVFWDNRRMIHRAYPSADGSPRVMFRLGIEDGPFFISCENADG